MKSILIAQQKKNKSFPKLMKRKDRNYDYIVLFIDESRGTVVHSNSSLGCSVGYHSTSWDMKFFEDFEGKITLSN